MLVGKCEVGCGLLPWKNGLQRLAAESGEVRALKRCSRWRTVVLMVVEKRRECSSSRNAVFVLVTCANEAYFRRAREAWTCRQMLLIP
jgi:hypothetical protein